MRTSPLATSAFVFGSLLAFLLIISQIANRKQNELAMGTVSTIGNVTNYITLYPEWFFQLLTILILLTLIGFSSTLSMATLRHIDQIADSSRWGLIRRLGIDIRRGGPVNNPGLVQWGFSLTALFAAIAFVCEEFYTVALQGVPALIGYVSLLQGINIMGVSIITFGVAYVLLIFPKYREASIWVLGLMWGFAECVWNGEIALIHFPSIASDFGTPLWGVYIASVSSLFAVSAFLLRHRFRRGQLSFVLLGAIFAFTPVRILLTSLFVPSLALGAQVPLAVEVVTSQLPWYFLILGATLLLVPRQRSSSSEKREAPPFARSREAQLLGAPSNILSGLDSPQTASWTACIASARATKAKYLATAPARP